MRPFRLLPPAALLSCLTLAAAQAQELPALTLDPDASTVSGLSSGAYMTVQMHVAFSDMFIGAGVVAGGPYYCAQDRLLTALSSCMRGIGLPDAADSVTAAESFAATGQIAPLSGLTGDRVFLFSGTEDDTVVQPVMDVLEAFYGLVGITDPALTYVSDIAAGHGFLAEEGPIPCAETDPPFVNACGRDQAGNILRHLYPDITDEGAAVPGHLRRFDQGRYLTDPAGHSMAKTGFVYVPQSCADGAECRLHIAFHGCKQGIDRLGDQYPVLTGYNGWAEENGIVVLYPQAVSSLFQGNPNGCWDWWGYDDPDYAVCSGPQMAGVAAMATALGVPFLDDAPEPATCISHDSFNSTHWFEDRADFCGFAELCAVGTGDPIGNWFGAVTLFETGVGQFQTAACES